MTDFLFIITHGFERAGSATRAFQVVYETHQAGHKVAVFLMDEAIHWSQKGMPEVARSSTGEEMLPFMEYLLQHEAPIYACKPCIDHRYITPDSLISGIDVEDTPFLVSLMAEAGKVVTF